MGVAGSGKQQQGSTYVPLWVKSNFTFLEGASHPHELVETAHAYGLPAVALTDRHGVYGMVKAHMRAKELGVHLLVGAELAVQVHSGSVKLVVLVQHRQGYERLCQLLSQGASVREQTKGAALSWEAVCSAAQQPGLIWLCGQAELLADLRAGCGDRLYALCARHLLAEEVEREARLRQVARDLKVESVAAVEVLYHRAERKPLQDVLTAIDHGVTLSNAGLYLRPNAEYALPSAAAMYALFADDVTCVERTVEVAQRCTFSLSELRYRYPLEALPAGHDAKSLLRSLTFQGARERYGEQLEAAVVQQLERELALIEQLEYGGYFLTMWEIVQFCQRAKILCQGRGSAANSAVCYCLGITAIDPVHMDLLFERFISRERAEPPDIDLDIEHHRREEVIQWVYGRYGRRHAAMVANVVRYRLRSAVRDVGKVLAMAPEKIAVLAKLAPEYAGGEPLPAKIFQDAGFDGQAAIHQHFQRLVSEIQDFPRHLSIHPGGFLLGAQPVDTLVPIQPARMQQRTVIQWDKQDIEDLGLFKVDLLGLGALTHLHQCFDLAQAHYGLQLSMAQIPPEDEATYRMLSRADTVGVFQVESRGQMAMLPRLAPKTFYDLVIEVAIVRPGPIQGDMVHPYLQRRTGREKPFYPHPRLERVLKKTLGVPIFQEQVMKLAMVAADYTAGEADQLRRDMAAWRSHGRIERHYQRLTAGMIKNDIAAEFAENIFKQIRGFGEYGFPESHAASFAFIAYATAWFKCHHHDIFTCALLNAQPMGFYSPATLVQDAKRHGVTVLPIDVQRSAWDCTLEAPGAVRMGLRYVKGLSTQERDMLAAAAKPFQSLRDFVERAGLRWGAHRSLAAAGAFDSLGVSRREALWALQGMQHAPRDTLVINPPERRGAPAAPMAGGQLTLFAPLSAGQTVGWDHCYSFHSTRGHPLSAWRAALLAQGMVDAQTLNRLRHGCLVRYVGLVICRQRPHTAKGVTFISLEDETGFVNVVVWKNIWTRFATVIKTAGLLGVSGRIESRSAVVHVVAEQFWVVERPALSP